jgi:hypothetical protein
MRFAYGYNNNARNIMAVYYALDDKIFEVKNSINRFSTG